MTATHTHPLVETYLNDLERALAGATPADRSEMLAGAREHFADACPPDATEKDIIAALNAFGPVERIAAEVPQAPPAPVPAGQPGGQLTAGLLVAIVALLTGLVPVLGLGISVLALSLVKKEKRVNPSASSAASTIAWIALVISSLATLWLILVVAGPMLFASVLAF